jgi:hypothetical protein
VSMWPGFGLAQVQSLVIVFDEGTDQGVGFVKLDTSTSTGR